MSNQPETGMGYQICSVSLHDGRQYDGVVIIECRMITQIGRSKEIPFQEGDIAKVVVTHDKKLVADKFGRLY